MEFEPVAQRKGVGELVARELPLVHHLRLDLEFGVGREQRVVHHVAVVARDVGGGRDRIQDAQVGLRDELQDLVLRRTWACGKSERQHEREKRSGNDFHGDLPYEDSLVKLHRCMNTTLVLRPEDV